MPDNLFEEFINGLPINDPVDDALSTLAGMGNRWRELTTPQQRETLGRTAVKLHLQLPLIPYGDICKIIVWSWYVLLATDDTIVRRTSEDNHADPE